MGATGSNLDLPTVGARMAFVKRKIGRRVKFMGRKIFRPLLLALTLGCGQVLVSPAQAEEIDWSKYMTRSAVVSAIASAMSSVENCSVPLTFSETKEDGKVKLAINCFGNEEDEASSFIEFDDYGDGLLVPNRFMFAG